MAKGYEFVEHTADVEFVARGKTLEEVFENSLLALFETMADIKKISKSKGKAQSFSVSDKARTIDDLLWFTLQDALSVSEAEGLFGYGVRKIEIIEDGGDYHIRANVHAKKMDQKLAKLDVKGVSKFDLKIVKSPSGFGASVVLDV